MSDVPEEENVRNVKHVTNYFKWNCDRKIKDT